MKRPQFRLSTLLWITLAAACWFGGMAWQRRETENFSLSVERKAMAESKRRREQESFQKWAESKDGRKWLDDLERDFATVRVPPPKE